MDSAGAPDDVSMPKMTIQVGKHFKDFKVPEFGEMELRQLGGAMVQSMQDRLDKSLDQNDAPMPGYSPKGPIYLPVFGVGTFAPKTAAGKAAAGASGVLKRTKTNLGGAFGLTKRDIRRMAASGVLIVGKGKKGPPALDTRASGKAVAVRSKSGKTMKFANYAEFKRAMGRSGKRDLYLSGAMRASLDVVRTSAASVEIGFRAEPQHLKGIRNQAASNWFGASPHDRKNVIAAAQAIFGQAVEKANPGSHD